MNEYKEGYEKNKLAADGLRDKLTEMKKQITELKNKRETLVARVNAAKAQKNNQSGNGWFRQQFGYGWSEADGR